MARWLVGTGALVLLLALGLTLWPASEPDPRRAARDDPGAESSGLLSAPLPEPRGSLSIEGVVLGTEGPLSRVVVVATAPRPTEPLSQLRCPCDDDCGLTLLQPECTSAVESLAAWAEQHRGEPPPLARATTDAQGHFRLEGLEPGTYALWTQTEQGVAVLDGVAAGTSGNALRVGGGWPIVGTVSDEAGTPVAGARVIVLLAEHGRFFETRTGVDGQFLFGPLPEDTYHLLTTKENLLPEHNRVPESVSRQEVVLAAPQRLTGRVLRADAPAEGATVQLEAAHRRRAVTVDAQGRFSFEGLRPGEYDVMARQGNGLALERVTLEPEQEGQELELVLLDGASLELSGQVTDEAGLPIAGAQLFAVSGERGAHGGILTRTAPTDARGHYRLGPLTPGAYYVRARAEHCLDSARPLQSYGTSTVLDFTMKRAVRVEGRTVDSTGRPVERVALRLERMEEDRFGPGAPPPVESVTSGKDGAFTLDASAPGRWKLVASHPEFLEVKLEVSAPERDMRLVLRDGATLQVEVVDAQGRPVPRSNVHAKFRRYDDEHWGYTDATGHVTLKGLVPQTYVVEATTRDSPVLRRARAQVDVPADSVQQVRLAFAPGHALAGQVVDEQGGPVAGAEVRAAPTESEKASNPGESRDASGFQTSQDVQALDVTRPVLTDPDGRFTLHDLAIGDWFLTVRKYGYALASRGHQGVKEMSLYGVVVSAEGPEVRLVLQAPARVRGRVVREDGTPVTRFTVSDEPFSDPDGFFEHPVTSEGPWELKLTAPELQPVTRTLQLTRGARLQLGEVVMHAGDTRMGRVVDALTSAPVAGATVAISSGTEIRTVRTRQDGRFTFTLAEDTKVSISHPDYAAWSAPLKPGEAAELTVSLQPATAVQGRVLDGDHPVTWGTVVLRREDGSAADRTKINDGWYSFQNPPPGRYVLTVDDRRGASEASEQRVLLSQPVEIPPRGTLRQDITQQVPGGRVSVHGPLAGRQGVSILPGAHALPTTYEEARRLFDSSDGLRFEAETESFRSVPLRQGRYTLIVSNEVDDGLDLHFEPIDVPAGGEQVVTLQPQWHHYPIPPRWGSDTD